jgi:hypothetical protein
LSDATIKCPHCDAINKKNAVFCADCHESFMTFGSYPIDGDACQVRDMLGSAQLSNKEQEAELTNKEPISVSHGTIPSMVTAWLACLNQVEFIFELRSGWVVGRQGDVDMSPLEGSQYISRKHALFCFQEGKWQVEPLSQTSSTYVNGIIVPRGSRQVVRHGDKVTLGNKAFLFQEVKE